MKRLLLLVLMMSGTLFVAGLWIPLKAILAQELLAMAWAESQARQRDTRPWPWADTWPVARLTLAEADETLIVLAGAHGESLAFGPGQLLAPDRGPGPVVIAGHRDTHFRSLQYLQAGSRVRLQRRGRESQWYRVEQVRVVDSRHQAIDTASLADDSLLLVTCYPFDSLDSSGPLRFVVEARAETAALPADTRPVLGS